jgi:hypothetical protein
VQFLPEAAFSIGLQPLGRHLGSPYRRTMLLGEHHSLTPIYKSQFDAYSQTPGAMTWPYVFVSLSKKTRRNIARVCNSHPRSCRSRSPYQTIPKTIAVIKRDTPIARLRTKVSLTEENTKGLASEMLFAWLTLRP